MNNSEKTQLPSKENLTVEFVWLCTGFDCAAVYLYDAGRCVECHHDLRKHPAWRRSSETSDAREDRLYVEGLEKRIIDLVKSGDVIIGLLEDAMERMTRARMILTDDNPRPDCNWGMLDVSDLKRKILEGPAQETPGGPGPMRAQHPAPCWCPYCGEPHSPAVRETAEPLPVVTDRMQGGQ